VCELASSRGHLLSSRVRIQVDRERGRRVMGCVQLELVRAAGHTVGNECMAIQLTKQFLSCTSFRLDATHARLAINTTFNFVHCQSISTVLRSSDYPHNLPKTLAGCVGVYNNKDDCYKVMLDYVTVQKDYILPHPV
jgi:hypothetical protein